MPKILDEIREVLEKIIQVAAFKKKFGLQTQFVPPETAPVAFQPLGFDRRLKIPEFSKNSLSLRIIRPPLETPYFVSTIFLFPPSLFPRIRFWRYCRPEGLIRGTGLNSLVEKSVDWCLTIAFSSLAIKFEGKLLVTRTYIRACRALVRLPSIASFVEVTGAGILPEALFHGSQLELNDLTNLNWGIGESNRETQAVEKFAQSIGLKHHSLYNLRTLGKVYHRNFLDCTSSDDFNWASDKGKGPKDFLNPNSAMIGL